MIPRLKRATRATRIGQLPAVIALQGTDNPYGDAFVMEFNIATNGETLTIPCRNSGVFNAVIDWGDGGATSAVTAYNDADLSHVYADSGLYTVQITGQFPNIYFNNTGHKLKLTKILNFGDVGWTSLYYAFRGCTNLTEISYYTAEMSGVLDLEAAFQANGCTTISMPGFLNGAVFSPAGNMYHVFRDSPNLVSVTLRGWNAANASGCGNMFQGCSNLETVDISGGALSGIEDVSSMFYNCNVLFSATLTGLDVSVCTGFGDAFSGLDSLVALDISNWDTSSATTMYDMFWGCSSLTAIDVTGFDTSNVTNMAWMFSDCPVLVFDPSGFNVESVTDATDFAGPYNDVTRPLDTAVYDATLIAWAAQNVNAGITISFGTSKYTSGGAAAAARTYLVGTKGWTITDGGTA